MKKITLLTAAITSFFSSTILAADFETNYMQKYAGIYPRLKTNAANLWPGFEVSAKHPSIIYFEKSKHTYALDFTTNNPAWQKQTINNFPVNFLAHDSIGIGKFSPSLANPYFTIENQQTIPFVPFDLADSEELVNSNILFSIDTAYQYYEFLESPYAKDKIALLALSNTSFNGFRQEDNMNLLFLESSILRDYLTNFNPDTLKDFVAVESVRSPTLDANTALFEKSQAPLVDNYIGLKAFTLTDQSYSQMALNLAPELNAEIQYFNQDDYSSLLEFIASGVDLGLDKVNPNWKDSVETKNISPTVLLQQFFHLSSDEIATRVRNAKVKYDDTEINSILSKILMPYNADLAKAQADYASDKGIVVAINLDSTIQQSMSWNAGSSPYFIDSNHILFVDMQKINLGSPTDFNMTASNFPFLNLQSKWDTESNESESLETKYPATSLVTIDGTQEPLSQVISENKNVTAKQIEIVDGNNHLTLNAQSVLMQLKITDGTAQITISNPQMKKSRNIFNFARKAQQLRKMFNKKQK